MPINPSDQEFADLLIAKLMDATSAVANQRVADDIAAIRHQIEVQAIAQKPLNETVTKVASAIYGNGKPGLIHEVDAVKFKMTIIQWVGTVVGGAILLALVGSWLSNILIHTP